MCTRHLLVWARGNHDNLKIVYKPEHTVYSQAWAFVRGLVNLPATVSKRYITEGTGHACPDADSSFLYMHYHLEIYQMQGQVTCKSL